MISTTYNCPEKKNPKLVECIYCVSAFDTLRGGAECGMWGFRSPNTIGLSNDRNKHLCHVRINAIVCVRNTKNRRIHKWWVCINIEYNFSLSHFYRVLLSFNDLFSLLHIVFLFSCFRVPHVLRRSAFAFIANEQLLLKWTRKIPRTNKRMNGQLIAFIDKFNGGIKHT